MLPRRVIIFVENRGDVEREDGGGGGADIAEVYSAVDLEPQNVLKKLYWRTLRFERQQEMVN